MPDPIFESLRQVGPLSPPDPSEIVRRADRRRRRTAIAAVAGAAALVVAVVAPVAALTRGDDDGARTPVTTPSATPTAAADGSWLVTVPADFPLADGLPMPGEGIAGVHQGEGTSLTLCGTAIWSAALPEPWVGVATSTNSDVVDPADGTDSRTLALYPDGATARRVLAGVAAALDACASQGGGQGPQTAVRIGDEEAWLVQPSEAIDGLVTAVRVGNAVLLQTDFTAGDLKSGAEELAFVHAGQKKVVEAMCIFAPEPCVGSTPTSLPSPTGTATDDPAVAHVDEIPADFPIDVAYNDPGSDGQVYPPSPDGQRVVFDPCGTEAFSMPERDRLAFQVTAPELADTRELRTYPSADDAVAQMQRLRDAVAGCPRQVSSDPGGGTVVWSTHTADTGYDSLAVGQYYDQGLGGGVWLFTRVGRSILAVAYGGEFGPDSVWGVLPTLLDRTGRITPSMCLFTAAGC